MDGEVGTDTEVKKLVAAGLAKLLTDEPRRDGEVSAGLGHGLSRLVLRLQALPGNLHAALPGRAYHAPAGVPTLRQTHDDVREGGRTGSGPPASILPRFEDHALRPEWQIRLAQRTAPDTITANAHATRTPTRAS